MRHPKKYAERLVVGPAASVRRSAPESRHAVTCLAPDGTVDALALSPLEAKTLSTLIRPEDGAAWDRLVDHALTTLVAHGIDVDRQLQCGVYGCAFLIRGQPDDVVKLTSDHSEAAAAATVAEAIGAGDLESDVAIVHMRCVYGMSDARGRPLPIFAIVQQRLRAISASEREWITAHSAALADAVDDTPTGRILRAGVLASAREHLGARGAANAERLLVALDALVALGIEWHDLHGGNVLRDLHGHWFIIDLGASSSFDAAGEPVSRTLGALAEPAQSGVSMERMSERMPRSTQSPSSWSARKEALDHSLVEHGARAVLASLQQLARQRPESRADIEHDMDYVRKFGEPRGEVIERERGERGARTRSRAGAPSGSSFRDEFGFQDSRARQHVHTERCGCSGRGLAVTFAPSEEKAERMRISTDDALSTTDEWWRANMPDGR